MSVKTEALEHWNQNKEWLRALDWDAWLDRSIQYRDVQSPIFSKDCPYCAKFYKGNYERCTVCPLQNESRYGCCKEWDSVFINIVREPRSKHTALVAVDNLIKHVKEAEDVG